MSCLNGKINFKVRTFDLSLRSVIPKTGANNALNYLLHTLILLINGFFVALGSYYSTLAWRLYSPTPLCFVSEFMSLLDKRGCSFKVTQKIQEEVEYLIEIIVCESYFPSCKPSSVGLAAFLSVFDTFDESTLSLHVQNNFLNHVQSIAGIDPSSEEVQQCKNRLTLGGNTQ